MSNLLDISYSSKTCNEGLFSAIVKMIRDGRFDLHINVKGIAKDQIKDFCEIFEVDYDKYIDEILKKYGEPDKDGLYNQSKMQNILLQMRKPNMSEALKKGLEELVEAE